MAATVRLYLWVTLPALGAELRELEIPLDEKQAAERAFTDDPLLRIEPERLRDLMDRYRKAVKASCPSTPGPTQPLRGPSRGPQFGPAVTVRRHSRTAQTSALAHDPRVELPMLLDSRASPRAERSCWWRVPRAPRSL
ncbi:MAG: hypothetical protein HY814_05845 [Candidatus Riflebacteria bacterium]|nr:hypothetical protein [Candidatus Riflebacteria bacterium]